TLTLFLTDATGRRSNELTDTISVTPYPWAQVRPPMSLSEAAAVGLDHRLYVLGGRRWDLQVPATTDLAPSYDPANGTWTPVASLPSPRKGVAAAVLAGHIYAIGGEGALTATDEYDPVANTWTPRAPMPTPRVHAAAVAFDGRIVVLGGDSGLA